MDGRPGGQGLPRWRWMRRKLSPAECMRASGDGQATASGNPEVAATPDAGGPSQFGELVPADTKLIPPSLARSFGILEALLVAANEASNRSSDGSGSKGGSGPGTAGKFDSHGGPAEPADAGAAAHAPRRQEGGNRRRSTEQGGPAGASPWRQEGVVLAHHSAPHLAAAGRRDYAPSPARLAGDRPLELLSDLASSRRSLASGGRSSVAMGTRADTLWWLRCVDCPDACTTSRRHRLRRPVQAETHRHRG